MQKLAPESEIVCGARERGLWRPVSGEAPLRLLLLGPRGPGARLPRTRGGEGPPPSLGIPDGPRVFTGTSGCGRPWPSPPRLSAALREASCVGCEAPLGVNPTMEGGQDGGPPERRPCRASIVTRGGGGWPAPAGPSGAPGAVSRQKPPVVTPSPRPAVTPSPRPAVTPSRSHPWGRSRPRAGPSRPSAPTSSCRRHRWLLSPPSGRPLAGGRGVLSPFTFELQG